MAGAVEFLQRLFALLVALIGAVEDAAAGRARSKLVQRLLAGRDHIGIEGHPHVIVGAEQDRLLALDDRSEEHTSELPSLMRISYAVFCLKQNTHKIIIILEHTLIN